MTSAKLDPAIVRTPTYQPAGAQRVSEPYVKAAPDARSAPDTRGNVLFALLMFAMCHAGLAFARDVNVSAGALVSYAQQQLIVWVTYVLVDERLRRRPAQFLWACLGTVYATCTVVDGLLLRMTSLPLREILPMLVASQNMVEGLREIGLKPVRVAILAAGLLLAALSGGGLRFLLTRFGSSRAGSRWRWAIGTLAVVLPLSFVLEQTFAREQSDYLYRGTRMPAYVQLYSTSSRSVELALPRPVSHERRAEWLAQIPPARNPKHVLYVLLESFRADAVNPVVSPNISRIAREGALFDRAQAEATYTPLSWSVLLFDEAAHDNLFGRHPGRPEPLGSWLLAVMNKAGYESHVYVSTNLTYARTRERLLAPRARQQLNFFQAASDQGDDPADKNTNDRVAVDRLVRFIEEHGWDADPQFMLLQLDSTHYTYPFPPQHAVFKPYSEALALPRPIETPAEAQLLENRYRNAAHFVDAQVGRVLSALEKKGVYEDVAVVVTADHGEGLRPGFQGHAAVFETTRHIPLIFKFPGRARSQSAGLISHRDILPTLAEYLGIDMPPGSTRGHPAGRGPSPAVLTLAPTGRLGQLVTVDHVTDLRLLFKATTVTVTPSASSAPQSLWLPQLKSFLNPQ